MICKFLSTHIKFQYIPLSITPFPIYRYAGSWGVHPGQVLFQYRIKKIMFKLTNFIDFCKYTFQTGTTKVGEFLKTSLWNTLQLNSLSKRTVLKTDMIV